jgi:PAS domain S-box-containing protein
MAKPAVTSYDLMREVEMLRAQLDEAKNKLAEAQEADHASQSGEMDAMVVSGRQGQQVVTLKGAEFAYRALLEAMNEGAVMLGADGTVLYCNGRMADLLGIPLEQIIGLPASQLIHGEANRTFESWFARAMGGDVATGEIELVPREGRSIPVFVSLREMKGNDPTALCMVVSDLSEQKKWDALLAAEEVLRKQAELLRLSFDAIIVWRPETGIEGWNQGAALLYGYTESEALGQQTHKLLATVHPKPWSEIKAELMKSGFWEGELRHRARDGREIVVSARKQFIRDSNGTEWVLETNRDITQRQRDEEQLRKLNRTLTALNHSNHALLHAADERALLDAVCEIVTKDCAYTMMWIGFAENDENKSVRAVAHAGFTAGYLDTLGISWGDNDQGNGPTGIAIRTGQPSDCPDMLTDPKFAPWRKQALERGYAASLSLPLKVSPSRANSVYPDPSGHEAFGAITVYSKEKNAFSAEEVHLLSELASDLAYGIATLRARAAQAAAEEALRRSEDRYRSLFNTLIEGFCIIDVIFDENDRPIDYRFLEINPAFEAQTGLHDAQGRLMRELSPGHEAHWFEIYGKVAMTGEPVRFENEAKGLNRWYDVSAYRVGGPDSRKVAILFNDITERRRMEQALIQSEKLASMGRMASTIAHEINNPLETIGNAIYLAMTDPGATEEAKAFLEMAVQELDRVTHITKQTLAFHRSDKRPSLIDLRECVDGLLKMFTPRLMSRGVTLEKRYAEAGPVLATMGEIQQIVSNLLSNSMDAVPHHGKIFLRISRTVGKDGKGVRLTIADTGSGIPHGSVKKIFEPFFTTKEVVGTGLGLWVTKQIAEKHGATIRVRSKIDTGTVFSLVFPVPEENNEPH